MCECEVCRRKKNRDPLNREFEPKKRVPEPKKEDCEPKKEDCELKKEDCDPKKEDCESLNDYSFSKNANFLEEAIQTDEIDQISEEYIEIVDSADVQVTTTDTKAALSIQAALQAAIVVVVSISIADSEKADKITQELFQKSAIKQINRQKTFIKNSRNVTVTTTDTDIAVNIQILLQILLALLVKLNIL
ncbi:MULTISPECIES: spore coat protein [Bacillus]|uniref:Spore coat protein X n=1 Tax=Bacillus cereus (strain ATCC 14579 / DSM 31 / CCUG 7414 / JCM 2152 / NBRC 15305 / NCIMB 9373 / NCTC 2599 / NRRL B-3711) TaxID=226900 RepID=Q81CA1_BACCR|nr:spore coat protein [Bacillus cereus]MBJ6722304.1 spore coat protein X [Bacillus sp. PR5]AAP09823.1 Spore coat protein X [Bacillus cereus ATCC 14579]EEL10930.1 Spore coat protein X [Bacillus cereus BDRD-Cer4]KZD81826.1 Spore coat protein X [Bacillus cereus]MBM6768523.1 spore coat protein X [Bacillus cereus]